MSQSGSFNTSSSPKSRSSSPVNMDSRISDEQEPSFSQAPEGVHEYEPYDERLEFKVDEEELEEILEISDIERLKAWISHVYSKLAGYDYYSHELTELVKQNEPTTFITSDEKPSVIVTGIKKVIRSLQDRFKEIDVGVLKLNTLEGSKLGARIQSQAQKASQTLEYVMQENNIITENLRMANAINEDLGKRLNDALSYIATLKKEDIFHEIPLTEKHFLDELKQHREKKIQFESSLLDDLALLNNELEYKERMMIEENDEKLRIIAEMEKDLELEEGIRSALLSKITTLESDKKICEKALNDWMKAIKETVGVKQDEIRRLKDMVKSMDDEIEHLRQEHKNIIRERDELTQRIVLYEIEVQEKYRDITDFDEEIKTMKEYIQELDQQYLTLSNEVEKKKQDINSRDRMHISYESPSPSGSPGSINRSGSSYAESTGSRSFQDRTHSPKYIERASSPIYPLSPVASDRYPMPTVIVTPPSTEYSTNTDFRQDIPRIAPQTQASSNFPTGIAPVNPSTQNMVRNRFDIGQNFNMHTVHSCTPSPYHQVTRLEASQPGEGLMIDSPVHLQHSAEYTPTHFVTPFISTTRYGYTDPTAKCLNLPPGDDLDIGSSLRKTLLLTSPRRELPLLVNIDVQPQPLTETADGEQFVCDISLNLQDTNAPPPIEPTYTYGVPPAVTPTTTRRHGQFTPRGIFKKRHYNIRRIFGPQYESPEMPSKWSPHYLPFDSRSPITSLPPSPYYSDRSISYERSYNNSFDDSMMNRTFEEPGTSAMNRTFEGPGTSAMNRTFEGPGTSAMNRTFEGPGASAMNRTVDRSPSPIIKPPFRRYPSPVFSDKSYHIDTSSPVIKGPSYRSPDYGRSPLSESPLSESDKTFDSASPVIKSKFYKGSSSIHGRKFDTSQSTSERNFDRSCTRDSFLDSGSSPGLDSSYGRSSTRGSFLDSRISPELDGSYSKSSTRGSFLDSRTSSALDGSYNRSLSPRLDKFFGHSTSSGSGETFDKGQSPGLHDTSEKRLSPRSDKSFNQSLSRSDKSFNQSFSPRSDKSFNQSLSRSDKSFNQSFSPRSDKSFNQSLSRSDKSFNQSFSPRSDKSFNQSLSRSDKSFNQSFSPRSDKFFNLSLSPGPAGTFNKASKLDGTLEKSPQPTGTGRGQSNFSRLKRVFVNDSPQGSSASDKSSIRDSPQQYLKVPNQDSPKQNGTFDSTSSNQREESDKSN